MAFDLENTKAQVRYRTQDPEVRGALSGEPDLESAVRAALTEYSFDFPRESVVEFAGTGTSWYGLLTTLTGWQDRWSSVRFVEIPAALVINNDFPVIAESGLDWEIHEVLSGSPAVRTQFLYFPNHVPRATDTIRIGYTTFHQISGLDTATSTTIPLAYEQAFYDLCAYHALIAQSAKVARSNAPTVQADVVNYGDVSLRLRQLADIYHMRYKEAVGLEAGDVQGGEFLDWDARLSWGTDMLFHRRRIR